MRIFKPIGLILVLTLVVNCKTVSNLKQHLHVVEETPASEILCQVGPVVLTKAEFEQHWQTYLASANIADSVQQTQARQKLLEQQIEQLLILAYASKESFEDDAEFRRQLRAAQRQLLVDFTLQKSVYAGITVTDDEITSYYNLHQADYLLPEQIQVRHILTRTREEAERALQRLREGADFGTVAREMSVHFSKIDGGVLPSFTPGTYDRVFEEAAARLQVGQISDIVKSDLGYHIIEKIGYSPARLKPLAEVKEEIRQLLLEQKKQTLYRQFILQLKQEFPIEVYNNFTKSP